MSDNRFEVIILSSFQREQIIDITEKVQETLSIQKDMSGVIYVFVPHTTAGITINENADPDVKRDILLGLKDIVSDKLPYRHIEGNSSAHLKTLLTGNSVTMPVENGKLGLGTWQGIYFCEFDGPRERKVLIKLIKE